MPERERPIRMTLPMIVSDLIRTDINAGVYVGALPSMEKLAERFGVSRVTMLSAIKRLEADGLLRVRQGAGTFVNVPGESQEGTTRDFKSERLDAFNKAIRHYVQFLDNSQIPSEVRERMIQVIEFQIGSIEQSYPPTVNPK